MDYNRFAYVRNNPLRHVDSSGHCIDGLTTIVCIAVLLKVVDYGWSAYDAYNSGRTLADPNASRSDKMMAGLNIALTVIFESIEPDEFLPVGLPADDIARYAMMKRVREAYAEGGEEAMQRFLREQMGDQADGILVTRATDPGWTPVFALISGVVLEIGGQLSHGAIVAREYGLPAVINVTGATQRIADGETITVDGRSGVVVKG